jgi:PAS domain S-box-containing protein
MAAQVVPIQNMVNQGLLHYPEAMRVILDASDIPINFCSADRTFLFVNKTYAKWYGRTPEQIIGKSIVDLLGEEGEETIRPYYERALNGEHFQYETEVNLSIGYRFIQCNYTPVFCENGRVMGWVGIIYDMTKRYLLEKKLLENENTLKLAKEKAEAASIAKSEFLATMSHEIRTPINAVIGLAHLLNNSKPLTEKQREFINTLQLSAQSLLTLINDLLDFSKTESNKIDLEHIPFSFSATIKEIVEMFSLEVQKKGISLNYTISEMDEQFFLGDPLRIRQILTNLVSNAIKFTQQGGITITLTTTPSCELHYIYVHVSVKDTGIGIPVNKINAVFDKFMQADMSITRQYGGSGLGLAICKNLAELMGGSITLKSALGEGSEFTLHLPLEYAHDIANSQAHKAQEVLLAEKKQDSIRVLLAEDHPPNVLVATSYLEIMGYYYEVASTGKEALRKLREKHFDVILMDVQMPELDGYKTTQILRQEERKNGSRRMPVIGVTAHVLPDEVRKCFESGMDDYIAKPFDPDTLQKKISFLMQNEKEDA